MSEKGLLDWFGKRAQDVVRDGSRNHGIIVLDTVSELNFALKAMNEGKSDVALKCIERLMMSEHEADRLEDRICADIVGGELSVHEREDLIHFVRKMDQIANWAKEAALHIQLIIETRSNISSMVWGYAEKMSTEIMVAVKQLIKIIEDLKIDPKSAIRNIDGVNDQERVVDGLYFQAIKQMHLSDMDPKAIMLASELISSLEMSADTCKACADTIMILLTSRRL